MLQPDDALVNANPRSPGTSAKVAGHVEPTPDALALAFGQATPDAVRLAGGDRVAGALLADRAADADGLGGPLAAALGQAPLPVRGEEQVTIDRAAGRAQPPRGVEVAKAERPAVVQPRRLAVQLCSPPPAAGLGRARTSWPRLRKVADRASESYQHTVDVRES
jgi:hypothetical protein